MFLRNGSSRVVGAAEALGFICCVVRVLHAALEVGERKECRLQNRAHPPSPHWQAIMEAAALKEEGRVKRVVVTGCLAQRYSEELAGATTCAVLEGSRSRAEQR